MKQIHDKKLAESLEPITKELEGVDKSTKKLREIIYKSDSENEIQQVVVCVEIDSGNSKFESEKTQSNTGALSDGFDLSNQLTKTLSALVHSSYSLTLKSTPSGAQVSQY